MRRFYERGENIKSENLTKKLNLPFLRIRLMEKQLISRLICEKFILINILLNMHERIINVGVINDYFEMSKEYS